MIYKNKAYQSGFDLCIAKGILVHIYLTFYRCFVCTKIHIHTYGRNIFNIWIIKCTKGCNTSRIRWKKKLFDMERNNLRVSRFIWSLLYGIMLIFQENTAKFEILTELKDRFFLLRMKLFLVAFWRMTDVQCSFWGAILKNEDVFCLMSALKFIMSKYARPTPKRRSNILNFQTNQIVVFQTRAKALKCKQRI